MARQYLYTYTVRGTGSFPTDMLRYDSAWPSAQEDAARVGAAPRGSRAAYAVTLHSHKPPTDGRWRSFGWRADEPTRTAL
jgi:hypothetical protein